MELPMSLWAALRFCVRQRTSKIHASQSGAWRRLDESMQHFWREVRRLFFFLLRLLLLLLLKCTGRTLLRPETFPVAPSSSDLLVGLQCFLQQTVHASSFLSPRFLSAVWKAILIHTCPREVWQLRDRIARPIWFRRDLFIGSRLAQCASKSPSTE